MDFTVRPERPSQDELVRLYDAVGWSKYTAEPPRLKAAIDASFHVFAARDKTGRLVGLIRTVSDGVSIAYIQDVLVHPEVQRSGVGLALMRQVLDAVSELRQVVLLTDAEPGQRAFYEACGFTEAHDMKEWPVRSFVRFAS